MKEKYTKHFIDDRADRATYILLTTGLGNDVMTVTKAEEKAKYTVTDEGVLIIRSTRTQKIITIYYLEKHQFNKIFATDCPLCVRNAIKRNEHRGYIKKQTLAKY